MSKQLMIKPEQCVGCRMCEIVCAYNREKNFEKANSAVSVQIFEEASICVPVMCMQCEEALCVSICPVGAMWQAEDGIAKCDTSKCIGCKLCVNACPMGNVAFSSKTRKIIKCELCGGGEPQCAKYCPVDAIVFTDEADALGRKKTLAAVLKDVFGAGGRAVSG